MKLRRTKKLCHFWATLYSNIDIAADQNISEFHWRAKTFHDTESQNTEEMCNIHR